LAVKLGLNKQKELFLLYIVIDKMSG